ncbi:acetyl-CoA carboxylase biotin carboxyl carrier protein subunit [Flavisericum labens]|uniref:acetyl-CoA carboxylase biotin carboxyl carrier protein subunit n=1 Tax=Flavisericum labens TaxID=3377112 RepID=UPI00387B7128
MSKNFKVSVNSDFNFDISEKDILNLDAVQTFETNYHIIQDHKPFQAKVVSSNFFSKSYQVQIGNDSYSVQISDDLDIQIKEMGFATGDVKQVDSIIAPMPGLILEINIEVGQEVKENDQLFILEAMKMENSMVSPRDGVIKSIAIKKGDAVEKYQLLIEFEE